MYPNALSQSPGGKSSEDSGDTAGNEVRVLTYGRLGTELVHRYNYLKLTASEDAE